MKKIFSSIAILAVSATCFTACFNLDEVAYSEILQESFVPNEQDVAALLASSYSEFGAFMDWYGMFDAQEEAADVVITPARPNGWVDGGVYQRMHEHTWYADDPGSPSSLYNYAFTGINAANRVMDQIKDGSLNAGELEEYALDELKAVRALWYAVLLDSHGNVPIVTSYKDTELPKQSSRRRVYEFVTKQFTEVIEHGVLSDEKSAATYGRLNMWGVKMALMRVYLNAEVYTATEQGKGTPAYDKALALAEDIIHNGPYSLSSKYLDNFQAFDDATAVNNTEIIFAIPYDNTFNTGEHVFCMAMKFYPPSEGKLHFGYTRNTWGGNCANPQFIKSYQEGDTRLTDTWLYGPQFVSTPARADNDAKTAKYFQDVKDGVEVGKRDQRRGSGQARPNRLVVPELSSVRDRREGQRGHHLHRLRLPSEQVPGRFRRRLHQPVDERLPVVPSGRGLLHRRRVHPAGRFLELWRHAGRPGERRPSAQRAGPHPRRPQGHQVQDGVWQGQFR